MPFAFLFFLSVACTEEFIPTSVFSEAIDFEKDIAERSRMQGWGTARLPGQELFTEADWPEPPAPKDLVVLEIGRPMVLLYSDSNSEFSIEVEQRQIADTVVESMWAGFSKLDSEEPLSGVRFNAGTEVSLLQDRADHQLVFFDFEYVHAGLFLPAGSAQPYYHSEPSKEYFGSAFHSPETRPIVVHPEAKLFSGPEGMEVGQLQPDNDPEKWLWATLLSDGPDRSQIEIEDSGLTVRAFVDNGDLQVVNGGFGFGGAFGCQVGFSSCEPRENLLEGTLLYDAEDGKTVGRMTRDTWVPLYDEGSGWWSFEKETPWGAALFYVRDEDRIETSEAGLGCISKTCTTSCSSSGWFGP
jgi:hypothetical protein